MGSRSNDTQSNQQSTNSDSRQVNDAGGGIAGSGNVWDTSSRMIDSGNTNWQQTSTDNRQTSNSGNTTWTDSGDKSQNWTQSTADNRTNSNSGNTTWNSDSSNRSTNNWDASNRSTTTLNSTVTDGGAIKAMQAVSEGQTDLVGTIARLTSDNASSAASAAIKAQENALSAVTAGNSSAFDFAKTSASQAYKSSADALGLVGDKFSEIASLTSSLLGSAQKQADNAASSVSAAYSSAASQANGNKTLTIAALAAVGLVAAMVVLKKG